MSKRKDEIKSAITIAVEKRADKFEKGHPLFLPGLSSTRTAYCVLR